MSKRVKTNKITHAELAQVIREHAYDGRLDPAIMKTRTTRRAKHGHNPSRKPSHGMRPALYRKNHHGAGVTKGIKTKRKHEAERRRNAKWKPDKR